MISWGHISLLWLLVLLIPFGGLCMYWNRQRKRLLTIIGAEQTVLHWRHSAIIFCTGIFFVLIALALPRNGYEEIQQEQEHREIVILLDVSQSMLAQDVLPSRIERAQWEIRSLLERLKGEHVALVLFAKRAYIRMPLSQEYSVLETLLKESHPENIKAQGSDIATALNVAGSLFSEHQGARSIVLVSDGEDHEQGIEKSLSFLSKKQISVYALGIGTQEGAMIPRPKGGYVLDDRGDIVKSTRVDDLLLHITSQTQGAFAVSKAGFGDWQKLYEQGIAKQVSMGVRVEEKKVWNELFIWPLGMGMVFFCFSYGVRMMGGILFFVMMIRPVYAQEVDVEDMHSIENFALNLYERGEFRKAELLLEDVMVRGDSASMRDRAHYNAALAAYEQGKLTEALAKLAGMEKQTPQSQLNAEYIKKEIDQRRKSSSSSSEQSEKSQDEQGDASSQQSQGGAEQEGEEQESEEDTQSTDAQKESSQSNPSEPSTDSSQAQEDSMEETQGEQAEDPASMNEEKIEGILSPEEWEQKEAERVIDSIQEGRHRGFGEGETTSTGTKTW